LASLYTRISQLEETRDWQTVKLSLIRIQMEQNVSLIFGQQFDFIVKVYVSGGKVKAEFLSDTGASAKNFVDKNFVIQHKLLSIELTLSVKFRLADNNLVSNITYMACLDFSLDSYKKQTWALITDLGNYDIIGGISWLELYFPEICYKIRSLKFNFDYCMINCNYGGTIAKAYSKRVKKALKERSSKPIDYGDVKDIIVAAFLAMAVKDDNQVVVMWSQHFAMLEQPEEDDTLYLASAYISDIAAITAGDYDKFFVKTKKVSSSEDQLKLRISIDYHDEFLCRWNFQVVNTLFSYRSIDYSIDLVSGAKASYQRVYGCSREQAQVVKIYIDDMLGKKFIRRSQSDHVSPVFIVKKSEGGFRVCVDYRALNVLIIKNRNVLSFIRDTLARLCAAKFYIKFDIIAAFNEVRMRKGDEHKIAFITRYDLFEYVVMFFGLCNASGIFQVFINETLREYLDDFCTVYLDNILIYSNIQEEHIRHVKLVLVRLKQAGLYLDIDKCEFNVIQVKYLGLIIIIEGIKMDSEKVKAIQEWEVPRSLKDAQAFLDFANFYRRFIYNYSLLAKSLTVLIKYGSNVHFSWQSGGYEDKVFKALKKVFTAESILYYFNSDLEIWIETDVSDFVVAAILSQRGADGVLHSIAYMSKQMLSAECNYEIYDKELLAVVRAFEEWYSECAGISVEDSIRVISDYKNLEHFMIIKQLNRRQARWVEFLSEFNFRIIYRSGVQGAKSDSFIRRSQDMSISTDDARRQFQQQTVLKKNNLDLGMTRAVALASLLLDELEESLTFIVAQMYDLAADNLDMDTSRTQPTDDNDDSALSDTTSVDVYNLDTEPEDSVIQNDLMQRIRTVYLHDTILQVIVKARVNGDRRIPYALIKEGYRIELGECEVIDNILYFRGCIFVSNSKRLRIAIIQYLYEASPAGYSGRTGIYELVNRHYYWLCIIKTVRTYVKVCYLCKRIKAFREAKKGLLKSLFISDQYWQDISCDFIVSLSECRRMGRRYQYVMVVVDRLSKKKKFESLDFLEVSAVVEVFIHYVWREEDYSIFIVSDRGVQFVSVFWKRLCDRIGIISKLSTFYYSETDGQIENVNAMLKQYLRFYVNYDQDNWCDYLSIAEFEVNNYRSSFTELTPFFVTKGYHSRSGLELPKAISTETTAHVRRGIRDADSYLDKLQALRKFLRTELQWVQVKQIEYADRYRYLAPEFREGDWVMLDGRNIKIKRIRKFLEDKNFGLYKIIKIIDNHVYKLELSKLMVRIYSVFYL